MSADVIELVDGQTYAREQEVIEKLSEYLEAAKAGRIHSIAMVALSADGYVLTSKRGTAPATQVIGMLEILKWDIIKGGEV